MKKETIVKIPFRHAYHKLSNQQFTTIRGASQFKRLKVGQVVQCDTKAGSFKARVVKLELQRVAAMSDEFLEADASSPGRGVHNREQFVALVNSFRPKHWGPAAQVNMDTEMTVIHLEKL